MAVLRDLDHLLGATDGDVGCGAAAEILEQYVDLELAGEDPVRVHVGTATHLRSCPGCRAEYEGLMEAARRFADAKPT
jgi:predicted anti-sigma-YlaC factor YlaD